MTNGEQPTAAQIIDWRRKFYSALEAAGWRIDHEKTGRLEDGVFCIVKQTLTAGPELRKIEQAAPHSLISMATDELSFVWAYVRAAP